MFILGYLKWISKENPAVFFNDLKHSNDFRYLYFRKYVKNNHIIIQIIFFAKLSEWGSNEIGSIDFAGYLQISEIK